MESIYWLILFIVLLVVELATLGLTTIWFAGGALVAFIVCLLGVGLEFQIGLFIIVSVVLLIFTRPLARQYINKKTTKTNVESLLGRTAKVEESINNRDEKGSVKVNGLEWTARSTKNEIQIEKGEIVTIVSVEGVKLIVEKNKEES